MYNCSVTPSADAGGVSRRSGNCQLKISVFFKAQDHNEIRGDVAGDDVR
jgi:hypothetical protein